MATIVFFAMKVVDNYCGEDDIVWTGLDSALDEKFFF